jgi:EmrB/QacA subfamily drug resistance transporter
MPADGDPGNQRIILAIISFAVFMATLDTSIVNISLPTIAEWFHTDMGGVSWVVMAYLLVLSGLMLAFGKMGDMRGFRRVFIGGFAVFTIGSLLCGLAATIGLLIAFRVVQGIGAAAIAAIAPAMIAVSLPADRRGWALGIIMTVASLAIAAGPVLGGYITEYFGWHWIFFINVPVGIVAVILAARYLPHDRAIPETGSFDTIGAVLILVALGTLIFPLNQGLDLGWTSPVILGSFAASLIFWAIFLLHERRSRCPLIDPGLFAPDAFRRGNITGMLMILVFAGSEFLLPFFFELVRGYPTEFVGLLLAVPAAAVILSGPVAGKLTDRYGCRWLMTGSALIGAGTLFLYSRFDTATGLPFFIAALAMEGLAIGIFMPPNMTLILSCGSRECEGVASSVMMTLRNVGAVIGVAVLGTIAGQVILNALGGKITGSLQPAELAPGFQAAFLAGAVICLAVAAMSAGIREEKRVCGPKP